MTIITASIDASGPVSILYRTLLASLPNSYRVVDAGADVALVAGTDFPTVRRAVTGGACAVVVDQPGGLSLEEAIVVGALADHADCLVVRLRATRLVSSPPRTLLTSRASISWRAPSLRRMRLGLELVEQLAGASGARPDSHRFAILHASVSHYVAEATMVDHPRSMSSSMEWRRPTMSKK